MEEKSQEEGERMRSMHDVAAALRATIDSGEYPPETPLPASERLAERFGVHRGTVQKAIRLLAAEGWLRMVRRHPAIVIGRPQQRVTERARRGHRDELGYYFDLGAKDWEPIAPPTSGTADAPEAVTSLLGTSTSFYRERLMAPVGGTHAEQISTSYIPTSLLAELPILGASDTGPGGIYDRLEEHFDADLEWEEIVAARPPDRQEQRALRISAHSIVLEVTRRSWVRRPEGDLTVEVNQTRMDAARYTVSYPIERTPSAARPRRRSRD